MSYASEVIERAKMDIIGHIKYEVSLIDGIVHKHNDADEEPYTEEEDWSYNPSVEVDTDNTYLDVEDYTTEMRKVVRVGVFGNGIVVETEEGDELTGNNIMIDYLVGISDCLDTAYKKLVR